MPAFEKIPHDVVVGGGRHGDRCGVDAADEGAVIRRGLCAQPACHFGGAIRVSIGDRDQAGAVERGHLLGVIAAEMTDADHAEPERAVGAFAQLCAF